MSVFPLAFFAKHTIFFGDFSAYQELQAVEAVQTRCAEVPHNSNIWGIPGPILEFVVGFRGHRRGQGTC